MRVIIEETAIADIDALAAWISKDSPRSGQLGVEKILHTIARLELFPKMGHEGRDEGTYERGVPGTPYITRCSEPSGFNVRMAWPRGS